MTSREWLAVAVPAVPALAAAVVCVAPRRAIAVIGLVAAGVSGLLALVLAAVTITTADDPISGDWLVVDATAGVFVGVIGAVGLASALSSPVYLRSPAASWSGPNVGRASTTGPFSPSGPCSSRSHSPETSASPGC